MMAELHELLQQPYFLLAAGVVVLLLFWLGYRVLSRRASRLDEVLDAICFDYVRNLVLPNGDDGEILIDRLLLTSQGLLILEIKEVQGTVFGSDKMQDWTVIAPDRRYTFPNPQPGLYDRIAAVREVAREVPVAGRVVFLDGAEFPKGIPGLVANLNQLEKDFGEQDRKSASVKVEAFRPHWEAVKKLAANSVLK